MIAAGSKMVLQDVSTTVCKGHVLVQLPGCGPPEFCCEKAKQQQPGQSLLSCPPIHLVMPAAGPVPTRAGCQSRQGSEGRLCDASHLTTPKGLASSAHCGVHHQSFLGCQWTHDCCTRLRSGHCKHCLLTARGVHLLVPRAPVGCSLMASLMQAFM